MSDEILRFFHSVVEGFMSRELYRVYVTQS
jgi:hypothetical protein